MARANACGLSGDSVNTLYLGCDGFGNDRSYERYPLLRGYQTGSQDGKPVAPLLGSLRGYDQGCTDLQFGPVTFGLAYPDHIVLYRFLPVDVGLCECEIIWLVRGDVTLKEPRRRCRKESRAARRLGVQAAEIMPELASIAVGVAPVV